jgi:hypothetical protein
MSDMIGAEMTAGFLARSPLSLGACAKYLAKNFAAITSFQAPSKGWIKSIRESIGMGAADLRHRLGIAPQTVLTPEKSELNGRAQMDSLKKVATEKMKKVSRSMKLEDQEVEFDQFSLCRIFEKVRGFAIDLAKRIENILR